MLYNSNRRDLKFNISNGGIRYFGVSLPARAVVSVLVNNGLTSGIGLTPDSCLLSPDEDVFYTLQGIRTGNPSLPGIYIHKSGLLASVLLRSY